MLAHQVYRNTCKVIFVVYSQTVRLFTCMQMDQISLSDATPEISKAAAVVDWHQNNLATTINELYPASGIVPDLSKFVIAGHSRGGKVAFGLATGVCKTSQKYSAVIGFDPVDGSGPGQLVPP
jgi:chlorophyllase